ncbi:hypothetical protein SY94_4601 [Agrobacterium tumefaciens]|nr:hypothetical protein SY94_4601 [Agrobacterium tumefaciens]
MQHSEPEAAAGLKRPAAMPMIIHSYSFFLS